MLSQEFESLQTALRLMEEVADRRTETKGPAATQREELVESLRQLPIGETRELVYQLGLKSVFTQQNLLDALDSAGAVDLTKAIIAREPKTQREIETLRRRLLKPGERESLLQKMVKNPVPGNLVVLPGKGSKAILRQGWRGDDYTVGIWAHNVFNQYQGIEMETAELVRNAGWRSLPVEEYITTPEGQEDVEGLRRQANWTGIYEMLEQHSLRLSVPATIERLDKVQWMVQGTLIKRPSLTVEILRLYLVSPLNGHQRAFGQRVAEKLAKANAPFVMTDMLLRPIP